MFSMVNVKVDLRNQGSETDKTRQDQARDNLDVFHGQREGRFQEPRR